MSLKQHDGKYPSVIILNFITAILLSWLLFISNAYASGNSVVVTREKHFNYLTWRIEAAGGTWYFEIESAVSNASPQHKAVGTLSSGFHSAIDRDGNDWIGNDCQPNEGDPYKTSREWRGWPNFYPGGFGHPCRGGSAHSHWLNANGEILPFKDRLEADHLILESWNEDFRLRYHFFASHAAIEVLQADDKYAFLFEGPIAGLMDVQRQRYVLADGVPRPFAHSLESGCRQIEHCLGHIDREFARNFPSPYFYFVDPEQDQVLFVAARDQSEGGDEGWAQASNMVIFSFGRELDVSRLTGTSAVSVFGFLDRDLGHEKIDRFIRSTLANPF